MNPALADLLADSLAPGNHLLADLHMDVIHELYEFS